jgi:hypothetical protein
MQPGFPGCACSCVGNYRRRVDDRFMGGAVMNPTYYNRMMAFAAEKNFDLWFAGITLFFLSLIGLGTLWTAYIKSTFWVLIQDYLGKGDVMIRKDAARFCVECDTIFDFSEGRPGCPCCGDLCCVSINELLEARQEVVRREPVFADRRDAILNRAAQFQGMLQGADGADCNTPA